MVRKHGWQLPAHTYQVIAITVFCFLVVAFYAFFAPFLGGQIWDYALIAAYSPVALLVFILYVRCTAINPADPGIMSKFDSEHTKKARGKYGSLAQGLPVKFDEMSNGTHSPSSSASRSSRAGANSSKKGSVESVRTASQVISPWRKSSCHNFGGIFCVMFVHEDCCKTNDASEQEGTGEDALFCTLCNAEVSDKNKEKQLHRTIPPIEENAGIATGYQAF